MPARRPARTALTAVLVALLSVTAAACGDRGALLAAGPTPTAVSPAKLWPDLRPASSPAYPYDVSTRSVVKGVTVPGDDIHKVDPVDVVEAEIKAEPDDYGSKGAYHATVDRLKDCRAGGDKARCPLLPPYYRDLTGDGQDDLTLGFRLLPTNQTAVRVYTVEKHKLVQVLADNDAILGVELAGRSLIERSPADISGYEYRTTWVWDPGQRAMVFSRDEYLHTGEGRKPTKPTRSATPAPSASSSASASASGSAYSSPSDTASVSTP
ncbi:hypothetical protein A6P39_015690 [Streptomyces sp. FXJ1.172]|uniref:hypothetical protein n=1 Tax=Streptomyces sp. FXJ1.172 TaxID=710705 RepID=UPI0007CF25B6|nr:hypothetical protein [Streptomyces sp. FXJ1.172]WEO95352.1 hypothetical protein A6P39_015690 [Streptomyces sp. FXJ1.172]